MRDAKYCIVQAEANFANARTRFVVSFASFQLRCTVARYEESRDEVQATVQPKVAEMICARINFTRKRAKPILQETVIDVVTGMHLDPNGLQVHQLIFLLHDFFNSASREYPIQYRVCPITQTKVANCLAVRFGSRVSC